MCVYVEAGMGRGEIREENGIHWDSAVTESLFWGAKRGADLHRGGGGGQEDSIAMNIAQSKFKWGLMVWRGGIAPHPS